MYNTLSHLTLAPVTTLSSHLIPTNQPHTPHPNQLYNTSHDSTKKTTPHPTNQPIPQLLTQPTKLTTPHLTLLNQPTTPHPNQPHNTSHHSTNLQHLTQPTDPTTPHPTTQPNPITYHPNQPPPALSPTPIQPSNTPHPNKHHYTSAQSAQPQFVHKAIEPYTKLSLTCWLFCDCVIHSVVVSDVTSLCQQGTCLNFPRFFFFSQRRRHRKFHTRQVPPFSIAYIYSLLLPFFIHRPLSPAAFSVS